MNIKQPIIIIGAPRSGTTLLFSILSSHPELWSLYTESEVIFEKYFHPSDFQWKRGNELTLNDASEDVVTSMRNDFYRKTKNYQLIRKKSYTKIYTNKNRYLEYLNRKLHEIILSHLFKPSEIRIVEKTPKNCMRISFINKVFPDAIFIYLTRDPRSNISSLIDGWHEKGRYETYSVPNGLKLKGYTGDKWNFFLPPDWERYSRDVTLEEVCAFQYKVANERAMEDLKKIEERRKVQVKYEDIVTNPIKEIKRISEKTNLKYQGGLRKMAEELPAVNSSTPPNKNKWKKNYEQVMSVIDIVKETAHSMGYLL